MKMIRNKTSRDLYWSNKDGWVDELSADRFSDKEAETLNLPTDGEWSPAFKNKDGTLTVYALACGYVEEFNGEFQSVRLWLEGVYHVRRSYIGKSYARGYSRSSWESFESLSEARKFYRKEIREIKKQTEDLYQEVA